MHTNDELVAEAMGAVPELLPLFPDLFADFTALGGWPDEVVELLREDADLPIRASIVDLGCGKGPAVVAIASQLGQRVLGVDLFEPFLQAGIRAAAAAGVDHLASFRRGDLRAVASGAETFDAAVFGAVGAGLLGGHADCVGALRHCVRPGGYLVISDGFLVRASPAEVPRGFEYYRSHDETLRQLTSHGDTLEAETVIPYERLGSQEDLRLLRAAVDRLLVTPKVCKRNDSVPRRRAELKAFMDSQQREVEFIETKTREAVWLLKRA